MITLNHDQRKGKKIIQHWYKTQYKQLLEVSGGPGTGKTTMIHDTISSLGLDIDKEVMFMAFMGKATNVMRMNGLNAKTIHSSIYRYEREYMYNGDGTPMRDYKGRIMSRPVFNLIGYLPKRIKLIVVDEAGMVPDQMLDDILSFDVPVIAVGDKDQLPPVFGSSRLFKKPDVILKEIMRQAKGSPIIELAAAIRDGRPLYEGKWGPGCYVVDESFMTKKSMFKKADIIICGKNKTKEKMNTFIREKIYKRVSEFPCVGDKIVCRKNNWNLEMDGFPLTNGTFGTITYIDKSSFNMKSLNIDFMPDYLDDCFYDLPMDINYLFATPEDRAEKSFFGNGNLFEYAYATTCQLSQGSQYDNVIIIEEKTGGSDFHRRWLYTAVTRAKKQVILIRPSKDSVKPKKLFKRVARS